MVQVHTRRRLHVIGWKGTIVKGSMNGGYMSTPIYQLVILKNSVAASQAWAALTEAETKALNEKEEASRKATNAKFILGCFSAWADEERPYWGLIRWPSLEDRIQHTQTLQKIGWLDKVEAFTLLGTSESEPLEVTIPNPIYKLWVLKATPAGETRMSTMSQAELAETMKKHGAIMKELGVVNMITCNSYWCNEAYPYFGIDALPSIEANMKMMQGLEGLGWKQVIDSFTLLGIPEPNP